MSPRLLFLTERFPPDIGGLARSAGRIVQSLEQLGINVDVVTWTRYLPSGAVQPPQPQDSPQIFRIGLYRHWDMTLPQTLNALDWLHQTRQYQLIWGHYLFPAGFLSTWFGQQYQLPHIVSARGNDIDRALFPPGDFSRLHWTVSRATCITAVSADMAEKIRLISERDDIVVLSNVVDSQVFSPLPDLDRQRERATLGADEETLILGFSGELREKKGQGFLLHAFTTVQAVRPSILLIIGALRPEAKALLQRLATEKPDLASRVIVTGHLENPEDIAYYLRLCDIYLQPSLWEGLPNALLEAMACGCCCIASDAGGIPEVVTSGENGFIVPRSNLHRLGEVVLECAQLPREKRLQMGLKGRALIGSDYSPIREYQELQALLNRLLDDPVSSDKPQ